MRPLSTIGWFMCQAIGTLQLDRDSSPLGLVARAWAADVEPPKRGAGYIRADRGRGIIQVSDTPWSDEFERWISGVHAAARLLKQQETHVSR